MFVPWTIFTFLVVFIRWSKFKKVHVNASRVVLGGQKQKEIPIGKLK
jgi:hypothetical protein